MIRAEGGTGCKGQAGSNGVADRRGELANRAWARWAGRGDAFGKEQLAEEAGEGIWAGPRPCSRERGREVRHSPWSSGEPGRF